MDQNAQGRWGGVGKRKERKERKKGGTGSAQEGWLARNFREKAAKGNNGEKKQS